MSYDPFLLLLKAHDLPAPQTEFVFHPTRKWRADYCWPEAMVIVEREGGLFAKGRAGMAHAMPTAIRRDMEKSNAAQVLGYIYLRFEPDALLCAETLDIVKQIVGSTASRIYTQRYTVRRAVPRFRELLP